MSLYLAVDAGGTKTEYLLADEHRELARVRTGTIKRMRTDAATATGNLVSGLQQLTTLTGISPHDIRSTCVGAAGSSVPLVADFIRAELAARISGPIHLVGDVEIALDAAFSGGPGIVAIAGTGSNVAGRDLNGNVSTTGGYGPALSDQASGHRVGYQALRDLFLALDQQLPTTLLPAILKRWDLVDANHLVGFANQLPAPDFSELAPVVALCADGGDTVAIHVLHREAAELAQLVGLMVARLQPSPAPGSWMPEVAFAGSMLQHIPLLRDRISAVLHRDLPNLSIRPGIVDPILGALWRARAAANSPHHL